MKKTFLLIAVFFLLLSGIVFADGRDTILVSTVLTTVRYELNDTDSNKCMWSNTVLRNFIQESIRDVASTGCIIKFDTIITDRHCLRYTLNSDFMDISPTNSQTGVLIKTSTGWKAMVYRAFRSVEGTDISFGKDASRTTPGFYTVVNQTLFIDPVSTVGDDTMLIMYEAFGSTTSDTIINVPYEAKRLVVLGALRRALLMNRENQTLATLAASVESEYKDLYTKLFKKSEPLVMPVSR